MSITGNKTNQLRSIATKALLVMALPFSAFAQDEKADKAESGSAFRPAFSVSLNAGPTFSYTDVKPSGTSFVFGAGAQYKATPYVSFGLDLQKGKLKGGKDVDASINEMGFTNSYFYAAVVGRFYPVGLVKNADKNEALHYLSGLYGGVGIGLISSSVKANDLKDPVYGSLKEYSGTDALLPIDVGFNLPIGKINKMQLGLNLNYRVNLCFTDKIDGYVPTVNANKDNDAFNQLTVGVSLAF